MWVEPEVRSTGVSNPPPVGARERAGVNVKMDHGRGHTTTAAATATATATAICDPPAAATSTVANIARGRMDSGIGIDRGRRGN